MLRLLEKEGEKFYRDSTVFELIYPFNRNKMQSEKAKIIQLFVRSAALFVLRQNGSCPIQQVLSFR